MQNERVQGICLAALARERERAKWRRRFHPLRVWLVDSQERIFAVALIVALLVASVALGQSMQVWL